MRIFFMAFLGVSLFLSACSSNKHASSGGIFKTVPNKQKGSEGLFKVGSSYQIDGRWYHPEETYSYSETGIASWYGADFHGKPTANGEIYDMHELTAAHKTLQLPSLVRVTNLENGRSLVVRVNDRGPFKRGRIIDLSKKSAGLLGFEKKGTAKVRVQVLAEESRAIAEAARRGQNTAGVEIAMNENGALPRGINASNTYQTSSSGKFTSIEPSTGSSAYEPAKASAQAQEARSYINSAYDNSPNARVSNAPISTQPSQDIASKRASGTANAGNKLSTVSASSSGTNRIVKSVPSRGTTQAALPVETNTPVQTASLQTNSVSSQNALQPDLDAPFGSPEFKGVPRQSAKASSAQSEAISRASSSIPGHLENGRFYPDPIVQELPVGPSSIYVQAGAFSQENNAQYLVNKLQPIGQAKIMVANVKGQTFYRVRLPAADVAQADLILDRVVQAGNTNALIVVD